MELPPAVLEKESDKKSLFSSSYILEFSRTGFALWVWSGVVRCHDGPVLYLLGAALTLLQADPCYVVYKMLAKHKWAAGFSVFLWLVLMVITWGVIYKNSQP